MLSGDNQRTASAIARQAGIDEAIGDLMPEQKVMLGNLSADTLTSEWSGMA